MMMKLKKILYTLSVFTAALVLAGCTGTETRYNIDYCGKKDLFEGGKNSYKAGEMVKLRYSLIATDTDYTFYVDGAEFRPDYVDGTFVLTFEMPEHDITVEVTSKNTMYMPEFIMEPMRCLYLVQSEEAPEVPDGSAAMVMDTVDNFEFTVRIINKTEEAFLYGEDFKLEKKIDGEYVELEPAEACEWEDTACSLDPGAEAYDSFEVSPYGELEAGEYRLSKQCGLSVEFEIGVEYTE